MEGDLKIVADIKATDEVQVEQATAEDALNDAENVIESYKTAIKEFFSVDGEGNGIKEIYALMKTKKNSCSIDDIDVNKAGHIYPDYITGMSSFINDIIINTSEQTNGDYSDKIELACTRDGEFITSLFGGENNPERNCTVDECFQNVEFLVDFIPMMDSLKNQCEVLKTAIGGKELSDVANKSVFLFCKSIKAFIHESLIHMVKSYSKVKHVLFEKDEPENTKPVFQLF